MEVGLHGLVGKRLCKLTAENETRMMNAFSILFLSFAKWKTKRNFSWMDYIINPFQVLSTTTTTTKEEEEEKKWSELFFLI